MFKKILATILLLGLIIQPAWAIQNWTLTVPTSTSDSATNFPAEVLSQWTILQTLLSNYQRGMQISLTSSSAISIAPGEVMVNGSATYLMLQNTSVASVTTANLDTGSIAASTTYYVYCGTSSITAATCTYYLSINNSAPTGVTYYAQLGTMTTDASSNFQGITNLRPLISSSTSNGTSFSANTVYQNLSGNKIEVDWAGSGGASGGWVGANQLCEVGQTNSPSAQEGGFAFDISGSSNFQNFSASCKVPPGWYWEITNSASSGGSGGRTGTVNRIETWNIN